MVKKRAVFSDKILEMEQVNKKKNEDLTRDDTDDSSMTTKTELESPENNLQTKSKLKRNTKRTKRRTTKWCKMDIGQSNNDSTNTSTNNNTTNNTTNNSANESPVELSDVESVAFCQPGILFSDVVSGMGKSKPNNVQQVEETDSLSSALLIPVIEVDDLEMPIDFSPPLKSKLKSRTRTMLNLPLVDSDCESNNTDITNSKLNFKRSGLSYAAAAASANSPFLSPRCRNRDSNINANLIGSINKDFIKFEEFAMKHSISEYEKPVTLRFGNTVKKQESLREIVSVPSDKSSSSVCPETSSKNFPEYADSKSYIEYHSNRIARILAEQEGGGAVPSVSQQFISPFERPYTIFPVGSSFSDENYLNKERAALRALTLSLFDNLFYDDKVLL